MTVKLNPIERTEIEICLKRVWERARLFYDVDHHHPMYTKNGQIKTELKRIVEIVEEESDQNGSNDS